MKNGYLIIRWRSNNLIGSPLEYTIIIITDFFLKLGVLLRKFGFIKIKHFNDNVEV